MGRLWIILNTEHEPVQQAQFLEEMLCLQLVDLLCGLLLPHHHLQMLLFSASGLSLLLQQLFPGVFLIV